MSTTTEIPTLDGELAWGNSIVRVHCEFCRTLHSHQVRIDGIYTAGCVDQASPHYGRKYRIRAAKRKRERK